MINYNFQEIVTNINNAFFRLESFMNGTVKNYDYFGFNEAFTKLFNEGTKPENFTYDNCKLISEYWSLTEQIRVDYDQSNFENSEAYENEMFCKDCNEIMYLNYDRLYEFNAFYKAVEPEEKKFSITDILKTTPLPPQQAEKPKPELNKIWLSEPKISIDDLLTLGIEKGIWNDEYQIITAKGSLYGTGKTMLGSLFIALKGFAVSENIDYKEAGKVFCSFFNIPINEKTKEPYKAFSSGNEKLIRELKRAFNIK